MRRCQRISLPKAEPQLGTKTLYARPSHGQAAVEPKGDRFDPRVHNAWELLDMHCLPAESLVKFTPAQVERCYRRQMNWQLPNDLPVRSDFQKLREARNHLVGLNAKERKESLEYWIHRSSYIATERLRDRG